jgi:tetratricopeptide (TPR) repeat protein
MPPDWKPEHSEQDHIAIAFWDVEEFLAYIHYHKRIGGDRNIVWVLPSYPKAWYLLAFMAVERQDWTGALEAIDQALALDPNHPVPMCEKAMILARIKRNEEAYELYKKAESVRPWTPPSIRAKALRGAGVVLIDLGRLDEARTMLKRSLALDPNSNLAQSELTYIDHLQRGGKPTDRYGLWR